MGLIQSVPDDEIAAELAASLAPDDEHRSVLERRGRRSSWSAARPDRADLVVPGSGSTGSASGPSGREGGKGIGGWSSAPLERRRPGDPRNLREAAERVRPVALARERTLPVLPALAGLLPDGLPRGVTVSVGGTPTPGGAAGLAGSAPVGATSLALALAAAPSRAGSWVAVVGVPALGLAAAAELGIALERLAVIAAPPPDTWAVVVGALVGAFDLVLFGPPDGSTSSSDPGSLAAGSTGSRSAGSRSAGSRSAGSRSAGSRSAGSGSAPGSGGSTSAGSPPGSAGSGSTGSGSGATRGAGAPRVPAADIRRLAARARERGSVLVHLDTPAAGVSVAASASRARTWARALDIDLRFTVAGAHWHGLGAGHGHLRGRQVAVELVGRRQAARPRRAELWLLDPEGRLRVVEPTAPVLTHPRARPVEPAPDATVVPAAAGRGPGRGAGRDVGLEVAARDAAFAGADIDELVQARRARLRQLARAPVVPATTLVAPPQAPPRSPVAGVRGPVASRPNARPRPAPPAAGPAGPAGEAIPSGPGVDPARVGGPDRTAPPAVWSDAG